MFQFDVEKQTYALKPMNCPGHWYWDKIRHTHTHTPPEEEPGGMFGPCLSATEICNSAGVFASFDEHIFELRVSLLEQFRDCVATVWVPLPLLPCTDDITVGRHGNTLLVSTKPAFLALCPITNHWCVLEKRIPCNPETLDSLPNGELLVSAGPSRDYQKLVAYKCKIGL